MTCRTVGIVLLSLLAVVPSHIAGVETVAARKERLAAMSAAEKERLQLNKARFDKLPAEEQARLRELEAQLAADPNGKQLRAVMLRYAQWLRALPSSQRAALLRLSQKERVAQIGLLLEQQEQQRFRDLSAAELQPHDQKVLLEWVASLIAKREKDIIKKLPPRERQRLERIADPGRRRVMMVMGYRLRSGNNAPLFELLKPPASEIEQLQNNLSPLARETLEEARDDAERRQVIQTWVRAALESRLRPQVGREELQRFFQEELTAQQREYLESLPRERMRVELQRMYLQHRFQASRPGRPFGNPRRSPVRRRDP